MKIRKEVNSLIICFLCWMAVSSEQGEKGGRKIERMNIGTLRTVSKYGPVSQSLWAVNTRRFVFPFPSFHWMNYAGHISSLCTRFHLQNGNDISSLLCKVFWDLLVKKNQKNKPKPKHTELVSSLEFHESTACKLCAGIILNTHLICSHIEYVGSHIEPTLCSWLWHHYSTWSKWSKIISRVFVWCFWFFSPTDLKILHRGNSWRCSHCRLLSRLLSPLNT